MEEPNIRIMDYTSKALNVFQNGSQCKLVYFFDRYKAVIHSQLLESLRKEPRTRYLHFVLETPEGLRRSRCFLDAFHKALKGDVAFFFRDQERISRVRAIEGVKLEDSLVFWGAFKEVLQQAINEYNLKCKLNEDLINIDDLFLLNRIMDCSYGIISNSFIEARNEIIDRRENKFHVLQSYAANTASIFEKERIFKYASRYFLKIFRIYGFFMPYDDGTLKKDRLDNQKVAQPQILHDLTERTITQASHSYQALAINENYNTILFREDMEENYLRFICFLIETIDARPLGVFFIHNRGRVFKLEEFDKNLLQQFIYLTRSFLCNCLMFQELDEKRLELQSLMRHLIFVQEKERKRIAADIHDTLTQNLTGIGLNALICQELLEKDPARLNNELSRLILSINMALKQSRQITTDLHPAILDDLGFSNAAKKLLSDFESNEDIKTAFTYSEEINMNSSLRVGLFRILQEALTNVKKHATATKVDVILSLKNNILSLTIADDGKGFHPNRKRKDGNNRGLGLLLMRERAEELGASLRVDSKIGQGCRIILSLRFNDGKKDGKN